MSSDYIPPQDEQLNNWQNTFVGYCTEHAAALGLSTTDIGALTSAADPWINVYPEHLAAQAKARTAREAKDMARESLVAVLRSVAGRIQANPNVSDDMRQALGLTVRSGHRQMTLAVPVSRPLVEVMTDERLSHGVTFRDAATPDSRKRPEWAAGCEVWVKLGGTPPVDQSECRLVATAAKNPYLAEYGGADAGKIAHYMLRWVNRHGERGPWSETVSATIPA